MPNNHENIFPDSTGSSTDGKFKNKTKGETDPIVIDMSEVDAQDFWKTKTIELKDSIIKDIKGAIENKTKFSISIKEDEYKEVVPACRALAKEIGIELGNFRINQEAQTAVANILGVPAKY